MNTQEILTRMDNLSEKLIKNDSCYVRQLDKGYRKGFIEAIRTIKILLEAADDNTESNRTESEEEKSYGAQY